ncbi:MAG TPA: two-component regulator propeller domain-containing protein, partial [Puia sp.]|nr:two-component regulator propeller domain-containing protein [Puia sp.]
MNIKKTGLLPVLILVALTSARAQGSVRYLGIEDGLSNNAVTQIYQDNRGFMWFGTYDGLNRYDGYKFKVFRNRIGDSSSLVDNNINRIAGASDCRLWVGGRKGLSVFNPVTETFIMPRYETDYDKTAHPLRDNILSIKAIAGDRVLVGTEHLGLFEFDARSGVGKQIPLIGSPSYEANAVAADPVGRRYWIFVQHEGLCRFDTAAHRLQLVSVFTPKTNSITADRQGNIWLGTDNGLFKYDVTAGRISGNYLPAASKVMNLYLDRRGVLWIACDGSGILLLDPGESKAQPLTFHDRRQGLSSNSVYAIYEDKENRKWIGTLRGGVNIIDPSKNPFELHTFPTDNAFGLTNNFIFSFSEAADGNIWVGTDGAGLRYWNRRTNASTVFTANAGARGSISSNFITSILQDSRQDTWVGTWFGGINRYIPSDRSFRHYTCFNPLTRSEENKVWIVYEDKDRRLWASTSNNGTLYLYDPAGDHFEAVDPAGISNLQCLAEDKRGGFWGGTYTALVKIDRVNKKHLVYPIGYPVRCIREDAHGNFWVGTDGGGL